jgi:hypothetical protein
VVCSKYRLRFVMLYLIGETLWYRKITAKFHTQSGREDARLLFDDQSLCFHRGYLAMRLNVL